MLRETSQHLPLASTCISMDGCTCAPKSISLYPHFPFSSSHFCPFPFSSSENFLCSCKSLLRWKFLHPSFPNLPKLLYVRCVPRVPLQHSELCPVASLTLAGHLPTLLPRLKAHGRTGTSVCLLCCLRRLAQLHGAPNIWRCSINAGEVEDCRNEWTDGESLNLLGRWHLHK